MQNIRCILREQVYTLTKNDNIKNCLTYTRYKRCYKSNACITQISENEYEIIIPRPPVIFSHVTLSGVEWNNKEYRFISQLQEFQIKFIKTTMRLE